MILTDSVVCCCLLPMGPALPCLRSAADMILADVEYMSKKVEGVESCQVEITFEPAWDKSMMSEEARLELGFM